MSFDPAAHMRAMSRVVRNLERDGKPAKAGGPGRARSRHPRRQRLRRSCVEEPGGLRRQHPWLAGSIGSRFARSVRGCLSVLRHQRRRGGRCEILRVRADELGLDVRQGDPAFRVRDHRHQPGRLQRTAWPQRPKFGATMMRRCERTFRKQHGVVSRYKKVTTAQASKGFTISILGQWTVEERLNLIDSPWNFFRSLRID